MFDFNTSIHMAWIVPVPLDFDEELRFISMDEVAQDYVVVTYTASRSLKTHHYCILWLQSTFVIYVVLYPYYMMYSNIVKELVFQYIEHSILRYEFVYDIIMYFFRYYLCSIGLVSSPRLKL